MNIIEDILLDCQSSDDDNTGPCNVVDALIAAAIDDNIHLDCVYFLLQRQPDLLVTLLSSTPVAAAVTVSNNNNKNDDDDDDDDEDEDDDDKPNDGNSNALVTRKLNSSQKRKREL
jgi:hypothetical protein